MLPGWSFGGTLIYVSSQFYKGDESNRNAPLPAYAVLGLHTSYEFWQQSEVYLTVQNVTDVFAGVRFRFWPGTRAEC